MQPFGVVEAGSTFSKTYIVHGAGEVEFLDVVPIPFKQNIKKRGDVDPSDLLLLVSAVRSLLPKAPRVHVFGTSPFRGLEVSQIARIGRELEHGGAASFRVVSAEEEGDLTARGATRSLSVPGNIAVMVGGGGSTEVFVFDRTGGAEKSLSAIGVGDVNEQFPDLAENVARSSPQEVTGWVSDRLLPMHQKAEVLVLAGGDFPLLYLNAGYRLVPNPYSSDPEKKFLLANADKLSQDEVFYKNLGLDSFRELTPDTPSWWDGARAMCAFVSAVASQVGATQLIPTRISMIFGVADVLSGRDETI